MERGCGCQKTFLKYLKPPYSKYFKDACVLHDSLYGDKGGNEYDRKKADLALYNRMVELTYKEKPYKRTWMVFVALTYYISVRIFGKYFFTYK